MKNIINYVCSSLECDKAVVYSLDTEDEVLNLQATIDDIFPNSIKLGFDIAGIAADTGKILNIRYKIDYDFLEMLMRIRDLIKLVIR